MIGVNDFEIRNISCGFASSQKIDNTFFNQNLNAFYDTKVIAPVALITIYDNHIF